MHLEKFQYNKHKSLLEKYYHHSDTPINNQSEKMFKPWLWDDKNGACWLIIDSDEVVATYACLKVEFDKNVAIKKVCVYTYGQIIIIFLIKFIINILILLVMIGCKNINLKTFL